MTVTIENKIYLSGNKGKGMYTLVDDDDYKTYQYCKWNLHNTGYASTTLYNSETKKGKVFHLHRLIMGNPKGLTVDHINGNRLDNRKENLRVCTKAENLRNTSKSSKNKYKGVFWRKDLKKFEVKIGLNGKAKYIGVFHSEDEAAKAYNKAALEYYGEFAKLNEVES